jgi:4-amino-4-deoxy-L-arabinose transferase-like glycosyltransferase
MSTITSSTDHPAARIRRWAPRIVAIVVLGWSLVELAGLLAVQHTVGAELYGILVAALAVLAGVLTIVLLASARPNVLAIGGVVVLWAVIALGGIAGTVAHVIGPVAGHGPVDDRPRPTGAPLVFTALGFLGGGSLIYASRRRIDRDRGS